MSKKILIFSLYLIASVAAEDKKPDDGINLTKAIEHLGRAAIQQSQDSEEDRISDLERDTKETRETVHIHEQIIISLRKKIADVEAKLAALKVDVASKHDKFNIALNELRTAFKAQNARIAELEKQASEIPNILEAEILLEQGLHDLENRPTPEPPKPCDPSVPLNYVYCQLPKEPEPKVLYPNAEWTDISADYANLFFRVEGNDTLPFGEIQEDQTRQVSKFEYMYFGSDNTSCSIDIPQIGWSEYIKTGLYDKNKYNSNTGIRVRTDDAEVRPRNTAIRCWKRTK